MEKIDLFTILKSITYTKEDISEHPLFQKVYDVFMVNRFLSMNIQTLAYANFLSQKTDISKLAHYKFLLYELEKKYVKFNYQKLDKTGKEDIDLICKYYKISVEKTKELLDLLSEDQLNKIKGMSKK